jgi:hypothetical protein
VTVPPATGVEIRALKDAGEEGYPTVSVARQAMLTELLPDQSMTTSDLAALFIAAKLQLTICFACILRVPSSQPLNPKERSLAWQAGAFEARSGARQRLRVPSDLAASHG